MKWLSITIGLTLIAATSVRADVFHLAEGGKVVGQLVDRSEDGKYVVKTSSGATITFTDDQVEDVEQQSEHQQAYEARSRALPDTVAAHRSLADWCKQHSLSDLADHHLQRILELDPEDPQARSSLGYQRHNGKWLTRDEIMAERGMQFYDGTYRTAQDIALRERAKMRETSSDEWFKQLRLWRDWLDNRRAGRADEALQNLRAVTDPAAATSVVKLLKSERDPVVRDLWMEILAQIDHPAAVARLIDLSIDEPYRETRLQCLDYLLRARRTIDITPYVKALKSKDNETVNIAAEALGLIGNSDAISPLIDSLVTTHKFRNPNAQQGNMSASFDGSGGSAFSAGGGPKIIQQDMQNVEVRRSLVKLSGSQDHGFNPTAWRRWFVNQQSDQPYVDPRRDR
ncbi:HEAT repeat domain-containing protein [Bythopirellula goksoeyrii]|nr:HEAT repeat domain-containing protein [Bythopirellula goksoeyrii]